MCITKPLVSVLLCTKNNRKLLPLAIGSYLAQDYSNLELVAVIDGDDSTYDLVKDIPNVVTPYFDHNAQNLATKRNIGIRAAHGDIIVHFDSDDWSGAERVSEQVKLLQLASFKAVGYSSAFWYDMTRELTTYCTCGVWGATLAYYRNYALENPWNEEVDVCEDIWFLNPLRILGQLGDMAGGENFVALAHGNNAQRPFGQRGWEILANSKLPSEFKKVSKLIGIEIK